MYYKTNVSDYLFALSRTYYVFFTEDSIKVAFRRHRSNYGYHVDFVEVEVDKKLVAKLVQDRRTINNYRTVAFKDTPQVHASQRHYEELQREEQHKEEQDILASVATSA